MFCSRQTNNMIKKLHERTLRIVLNDQTSNFETLLVESSDIFNRLRNIQTRMSEGYKIQNNLASSVRNPQEFVTQRRITVNYGLKSFSN